AFPKDCSLWVMVREGEEINRLTATPKSRREGNFHVYKFPMRGLAFTLIVSKNIPTNSIQREACFVHGSGNPIFVTTIIEQLLENDAVKMLNGITDRKRFAEFLRLHPQGRHPPHRTK